MYMQNTHTLIYIYVLCTSCENINLPAGNRPARGIVASFRYLGGTKLVEPWIQGVCCEVLNWSLPKNLVAYITNITVAVKMLRFTGYLINIREIHTEMQVY